MLYVYWMHVKMLLKKNKDMLTAITLMKKENEYKDVILNVECDPFSSYY